MPWPSWPTSVYLKVDGISWNRYCFQHSLWHSIWYCFQHSSLQKTWSYTQITLRLECSTANSTPLSTPFGTAFSTPFSTRDLHINEVSSAKRSANLNNWHTPNGTVFSTPKDLKLNTTNNTPLECSTTNSTLTNGVLFGVLHPLASFDTRNNTRNSTNMSTASP